MWAGDAVLCKVKMATDKKWFGAPVWVWVTLQRPAFLRWQVATERPEPQVMGTTASGAQLIQYPQSEAMPLSIITDIQPGVPQKCVRPLRHGHSR